VSGVARLVRKDLVVLRRSPAVLAALLAYPLLVALLVALVSGYAGSKPRVGLVDLDGLPATLQVAGQRFHVQRTIDRVSREIDLVRLEPEEARRRLETGDVVATITVPHGFVADLRSLSTSPRLLLETTRGGVAPRVTQQAQALVYALNRELSDAYVEENLEYVRLLREGGTGSFAGRRFEVLGLRGAAELLDELPPGPRLDRIREFVTVAGLALGQTGGALRATANPIELEEAPERGRTWALSAVVQGYALAVTLVFLGLLLSAGSLAAERDENVLARLARGPLPLGRLVAAKVLLTALVSLVVGLAVAVSFGVVVEAAGVRGGEPWSRFPLLVVGLALAGAAVGALGCLLGALARDARSASLAAVLVVLPIVFVGLVPREAVRVAGLVSDVFPFAHATRLFSGVLYEPSPWRTLAVEAAWLVGLALVAGALARLASRRLLA
jgi:ABC-2 type transport system permease protein